MKINQKITLIFSITAILLVEAVGFISFQSLESAVTDSEVNDMKAHITTIVEQMNQIHLKASKDMTLAEHQFELFPSLQTAESMSMDMSMNMSNSGTSSSMQTDTNSSVGNAWMKDFQTLFDVPATCYLHPKDSAMYQKIVSEEASATSTGYGDVYIEPPYISPHIGVPVIAYVTNLKQNGLTSAIFHCEIPFTIFDNIVKTDSGTISIIDAKGDTIVSSSSNKTQSTNSAILNILGSSDNGFGTYVQNGETNYVVHESLPTFGWSIIFQKPYSELLGGNTSLSQLELKIFIAAVSVGVAGAIAMFLISSRISRPIMKLANDCRHQDVSNLKKMEVLTSKDEVSDVANAINEMIDKVNSLEKQREEFSSMITHELKTPLVPIIGWCGNLKNPKIMGSTLTERQISGVNSIERNAKRLEQLIGDIMDVQKLDLQKMKFDHHYINTTEFMRLVHSNLHDAMRAKEIKFTNSTLGDNTMKVDKGRLEQVLTNLILNAVDFVPVGGTIEIGAKDNGDDFILFYVKDNGVGIKEESQKDLFKKFYQVDTSFTRNHGGSGLGLAICKGIVEASGGKIWFESEEGKGASFYFTIPKSGQGETK